MSGQIEWVVVVRAHIYNLRINFKFLQIISIYIHAKNLGFTIFYNINQL